MSLEKHRPSVQVEKVGKGVDAEVEGIRKASRAAQRVSENPLLKEAAFVAVSKLDDSALMAGIRKTWDTLPKQVQWLIIHKPDMVMPDAISSTFKYLFRAGLLEYSGGDDKKMAEQVAKTDSVVMDGTIAVSKLISPATVKALEPSLRQVFSLREKALQTFRTRLQAKHEGAKDRQQAEELRSTMERMEPENQS